MYFSCSKKMQNIFSVYKRHFPYMFSVMPELFSTKHTMKSYVILKLLLNTTSYVIKTQTIWQKVT